MVLSHVTPLHFKHNLELGGTRYEIHKILYSNANFACDIIPVAIKYHV